LLIQLVVWLNYLAGAVATVVLAPLAWLPGCLSVTIIALVTGIAMLVVFKHTSHQSAIRRTRNQIKANLLALSLFKDNLGVSIRAQVSLLWGAATLIGLSIVPTLVMSLPICLLLGQIGLRYQARPLRVGEEAVVTAHLADDGTDALADAMLTTSPAVTLTIGPIRIPSKHMICWNVRANQPGFHSLTFEIGGRSFTKELAVGEGFIPTSLKRPQWTLSEVLLHPREEPLPIGMLVESIEVDFPSRSSWTSGTDCWLVYWFLVSMAGAFVARRILGVEL
jgi:hypothetical protein